MGQWAHVRVVCLCVCMAVLRSEENNCAAGMLPPRLLSHCSDTTRKTVGYTGSSRRYGRQALRRSSSWLAVLSARCRSRMLHAMMSSQGRCRPVFGGMLRAPLASLLWCRPCERQSTIMRECARSRSGHATSWARIVWRLEYARACAPCRLVD